MWWFRLLSFTLDLSFVFCTHIQYFFQSSSFLFLSLLFLHSSLLCLYKTSTFNIIQKLLILFWILNFPPSIPLAIPWWQLSKTLVTPPLLCAHIHLLSYDWERQPCPSKYFNFVSMCVFVCLSLQFLVRVLTFLSIILCY